MSPVTPVIALLTQIGEGGGGFSTAAMGS